MFGIGFPELIIILIIALLVVGPERLPQLAAQAGRAVRDLRRMYANLRAELGPEFEDIERGIREIQSLDPRRQIREYGRELLDDISRDAPEVKQIARNQRLNLDQLGRELLNDDLLDRPLAETRARSDSAARARDSQETMQRAADDSRAASGSAPPNAPQVDRERPIETTGHYE